MTAVARRLRRLFYELRTEAGGPRRDAAALGLGVLIGCVPVYGFHLLLVWAVGRLLRLNRLKMYVAANISNPLFSPVLLFAELQTGAWVRRQDFHDLSLSAIRTTNLAVYAGDIFLGGVIIGTVLGLGVAAVTYATSATVHDDPLAGLWEAASDPYLPFSITGWEFARGKLRGDPVYRAIVTGGLSNRGGSLVDIGCGQGLLLSVLIQAQRLWSDGAWPPGMAPPPRFDRMLGVELRPRIANLARRALGPAVELVSRDARRGLPENADAVVFCDVLHMMTAPDQEHVIREASAALAAGGVILIRDADPSGGAQFTAVRVGNRLKAIVSGRWRQPFHFRTREAWTALLEREGLRVTVQPMREGTPFANFLMRGVRSADGSSLNVPADANDGGAERLRRNVEISPEPERARHS